MNGVAASALVAVLMSLASAYFAYGFGVDHESARQAKESRAVDRSVKTLTEAAATAIASLKERNAQVHERLVQEVRTDVVYRDCVASPDVLRLSNAAITGSVLPAGGGELPEADADGHR